MVPGAAAGVCTPSWLPWGRVPEAGWRTETKATEAPETTKTQPSKVTGVTSHLWSSSWHLWGPLPGWLPSPTLGQPTQAAAEVLLEPPHSVRAKFLMLAQKYRKWLCFAFFPRSLLNVSAHETSPLQVQDCPPWLTALSRKYLPARRPGLRTWLWPLATPFLPLIPKQRCAPAFTIWFSYFSSVLLLDSKSDGFPRFI